MGAGPEKGGVCGWWGVAASQSPRRAKGSSFSPSTLRRGPVELFVLRICRTMLARPPGAAWASPAGPRVSETLWFLYSPSVELQSWVNERVAFLIVNLDNLVGLK